MEAAAQKKSNSRRRAAIQDYELRLANSHSPIAVVGLVFILIMCVVDGVPPSCGLDPDSGGRAYRKNQSLTLAVASHLSDYAEGGAVTRIKER